MNHAIISRRRRNVIAITLAFAATLVGLGWLLLILGSLFWEAFRVFPLRSLRK